MAKTLNRVSLLGNVGKDPEIKATQAGTVIANFSIATVDAYKNQAGEWMESTDWTNCVAFGRLAEIIRDYVKKGSKLFAEGKLKTRSWDDKTDGKKHYRTEVIVSDLTLLGGNGKSDKSESKSYTKQDSGYSQYSQPTAQDITDDDIPF